MPPFDATTRPVDAAAVAQTKADAARKNQSAPEARPIGAAGNNTTNPALNPVAGTPELRIAPPNFADANRGLISGTNPRTISNILSTQPEGVIVPDANLSAMIYTMGQFVDHDLDLATTAGGANISVAVPAGDPDLPDGTIIPMARAAADPTTNTIVNTVAGYLDLSQVYGSDTATATSLRNADGTLKTSAGNALPIVNGQFVSGDVRVMENPELVAMTTLFMREHNRLVAQLSAQDKKLTGDQLYDMARTINIAEYQHVIYSEWLPALIGAQATGSFAGYNPAVNAQVTQEFATSAFRVGHSQVSNEQTGIDNQGNEVFTQSLAAAFFNTPAQDVANGIDALLRNLPNDDSQATDTLAVTGLRNLLFAPPNAIDLMATDVQRERDVGIGTLNQTRAVLGLPAYTSFDQITSDPAVATQLQQAFGTVDNVDLFMGGLAENHAANGGVVGPTFQAVIADQFSRLRAGDRFFWENQALDPKLKATIGSTTLGDIMARNTATNVFQPSVLLSAERHLSNVEPEEPTARQLVIGIDDRGATISGGPADDTVVAGAGKDQTLVGGDGADTFTFMHAAAQQATIADFQDGADRIRFTLDAKDFHINATQGGSVIHWGNDQITVVGVAPSAFSMADFILPPGSDAVLKV